MHRWGEQLLSVNAHSPDVRQRGRLLIICAVCLLALTLLTVPLLLSAVVTPSTLILLSVGLVFATAAGLLGRAGYVSTGAYMLIGFLLVAVASAMPTVDGSAATPFFMLLPVLFAAVLLPPPHLWAVLALSLVALGLGASLLPSELLVDASWRQSIFGAPLLVVIAATVLFLRARLSAQALAEAQRERAEAAAAVSALAAANARLEGQVAESAARAERGAEQPSFADQLQASLATQQELTRLIAELSVPIIPISAGTLIVPLVGSIDTARASALLSAVLEQVELTGAHTIVLDVTGVAVVDTQVAAALLRVADAARLMGASTMLVGIRPEVAQTLVHLGVDLGDLRTAATLQVGLNDLGVLGAL